ncbi:MAG: hypothetical protein Q8K71_06235, partial [Polaromonas sp.]|nr:hypothetical protein [Polaromonas sp.]
VNASDTKALARQIAPDWRLMALDSHGNSHADPSYGLERSCLTYGGTTLNAMMVKTWLNCGSAAFLFFLIAQNPGD